MIDMKKALCINPWICDFAAFDLWMKPLGLLYIARVLANNNFAIDYIDCLDARISFKKYGSGKFYSEEIEKPEVYRNFQRKYKRFGIKTEDFLKRLQKIS
ncbi:radical SAM protein, partial [bacterium]